MTTPLPAWTFDEFSPVGVDLNSETSVERYDRNQGTSAEDDNALLDRLSVGSGTVFVDLGTGTGSLPVQAAMRGAEAHAVDVSATMLEYTRRRAETSEVAVEQHHAGFLSYDHIGADADVVTTRSALHQLPDTWKQVALNRIAKVLRRGGVFYLWDVMWSFDPETTTEQLPTWVSTMAKPGGEGFTKEMFETHVREEFSTFTWVLEGMIERAGLTIVERNFPSPWYGELVATR